MKNKDFFQQGKSSEFLIQKWMVNFFYWVLRKSLYRFAFACFSSLLMTRLSIVHEIDLVTSIVENGEANRALPLLLEIAEKIVETRFYPLLDSILPMLIPILEKEKDYNALSIYYLIRNSRYIHSNEIKSRYSEFSEFVAKCPEIQVTIPPQYVNIIPLVSSFHYLPHYEKTLHLICDFKSYFDQIISIDNIIIEFISNNGQNFHHQSLGQIVLHPFKYERKKLDYEVDLTTTYEKVNAVIYVLKQCTFRIEKEFHADLAITPLLYSVYSSNNNTDKQKQYKYPFRTKYQIFNENFMPISEKVVPKGEFLMVELTLTNALEYTSTISQIISHSTELLYSEIADLPIDLFPGEQYSFRTLIKHECNASFIIHFTTELSDEMKMYEFNIGNFVELDRQMKIELNSPSHAVKGQPFDSILSVEVEDGKEPFAQIFIDVASSPNFFVKGPSRKYFYLFTGQKKEIKFSFVPLSAGPTALPAICVNNLTVKGSKPRIFFRPLIVTF